MMTRFSAKAYGPVVAELLAQERLNELGPGRPNAAARPQLEALTLEGLAGGRPLRDRDMASCCLAALWLYHDHLDEAHRTCQVVETVEGSYWHGILHRREPDFSNSKYWFRRVGDHPVFETLAPAAAEFAAQAETDAHAAFLAAPSHWDPFRFIDLCEACLAGRSSAEMLCRRIQQREWELLFDDCYRRALRD
jgi:hypothetical protein